jgi:hypothetical protein
MSAAGTGYRTLHELDQIRPQTVTLHGTARDHVRALLVLAAVFALMWAAAALGTLVGGPTPDTRYEDGTTVWSDGHVTCERGALCDR